MFDPTATYRTSQVVSASKAGQIVLLYQGAIRFGLQHLAWLESQNVEQAHRASLRCQEIVASLRGSLDLSAGPIALQLDQLYEFVQGRLLEGNMTKEARPTQEALQVLRGLLDAWQDLAARPAESLVDGVPDGGRNESLARLGRIQPTGAGTFAVGGARR
jgi:flagellar secretion chaperone FliS